MIQLRLDQASRAANLQNLLARIREAAATRPAPDLLVLPAYGAGDSNCPFPVQIREAVAFEARDWGVWVALGIGDARSSGVWLVDADGDVPAATCDDGAEHAIAVAETAWGRLTLSASLDALSEVDDDVCTNALAIVPLRNGLTNGSAQQWAERLGDRPWAGCALVCRADASDPIPPTWLMPNGKAISADRIDEQVFCIDVDLPVESTARTSVETGRSELA